MIFCCSRSGLPQCGRCSGFSGHSRAMPALAAFFSPGRGGPRLSGNQQPEQPNLKRPSPSLRSLSSLLAAVKIPLLSPHILILRIAPALSNCPFPPKESGEGRTRVAVTGALPWRRASCCRLCRPWVSSWTMFHGRWRQPGAKFRRGRQRRIRGQAESRGTAWFFSTYLGGQRLDTGNRYCSCTPDNGISACYIESEGDCEPQTAPHVMADDRVSCLKATVPEA